VPDDVHGVLEQVGRSAAGRGKRELEVAEGLFGLSTVVACADEVAVGVECDLACYPDDGGSPTHGDVAVDVVDRRCQRWRIGAFDGHRGSPFTTRVSASNWL